VPEDYLKMINLVKKNSLYRDSEDYRCISKNETKELRESMEFCVETQGVIAGLKNYIYEHFVVDNSTEEKEVYDSIVGDISSAILSLEELVCTTGIPGTPIRKVFKVCFEIYIEEFKEIRASFSKGS